MEQKEVERNVKIRLLLEGEKELTENLTVEEKYRYYLGRMQFMLYTSGAETIGKSDCSGSVCLALLLSTGYGIRVTADTLYRKYFTLPDGGKNTIRAAFFLSNYDRAPDSTGRIYHENEAAHVVGLCGDDVCLDCSPPRSRLRCFSTMVNVYRAIDYRCVVRSLNMAALKEAAGCGRDLFGPDEEFKMLMGGAK